ncbi:MAG TPA: tyrosine--tRNA ligase [Patescibacteria group bacterium]|nr:tyrosine--tRNA ligase [Patescibacteria group bacterium]
MDKIEELLTRGVDAIYPTKEELEKVLRSGKKLTLYQGFDPTGDKLHIGHMVGLMKLAQWQSLGHKVIFLIGDFTGMIGDPSGKTTTRPMLTSEEVQKNAESYKEQAGKILQFTGDNPVQVRFNSEWLGKISAIEFIKIAGLLSVQQVVERDLFQERQKSGQDIYMNEFLYPVMQAYDSVAMNVDLEIGGSDQMFNMLMGRKLMRHMLKKDKFVMTTSLLVDSEGRKIGKTEGNAIALTDKPEDLFGKIMAFPDGVVVKAFECLTTIPLNEVQKIKQAIENGDNPITYKKRLAFEIVKQLNSADEALHARETFEKVVQQKETPTDVEETDIDILLAQTNEDLLVQTGLAASKSDAKRLIEQGGVAIDDVKISDPHQKPPVENGSVIRVGKRRTLKLNVS